MEHPIVITSRREIEDGSQSILARYLKSSAGRSALASAMAQPLRTRLDYSNIARKTFVVEQLPAAALPCYDKDIDVASEVISSEEVAHFAHNEISIGSNGKVYQRGTFPGRVVIPKFEIFSNPTFTIGDIKRRRFPLIDRAVQKTRQELMSQEDDQMFKTLENIANDSGSDDIEK